MTTNDTMVVQKKHVILVLTCLIGLGVFMKEYIGERIHKTHGKITDQFSPNENLDRIETLERKLSELHEKRIDLLEKFQKYQMRQQIDNARYNIPQLSILSQKSIQELSTIFHEYLEYNIQYICKNIIRMGKLRDGGWEICEDEPYRPTKNSLVYSIGINHDFSFDDAISSKLKVKVHSFDPSMNVTDYKRSALVTFYATGLANFTGVSEKGWKMSTLQDIKKTLGHEKDDISVFKMDIEGWEWKVLPNLIQTKSLDNIHQLLIEFHFRPEYSNKQKIISYLQILKTLYELGFRIFWSHKNVYCTYKSKFTKTDRTFCHEITMVKVS